MKSHAARVYFALAMSLVLWTAPAPAQPMPDVSIYLDFDDDGDPWTLRTSLPGGVTSATVKFVLEVGSLPLPALLGHGVVTEGCCNGPEYDGHYGTSIDALSVAFDPVYVQDFSMDFPTCTYCCPWALSVLLRGDAPLVTLHRYFIGHATWNAHCNIPGPCSPPTDFTLSFAEFAGFNHMYFNCPPTPAEPYTWGRVKSLYR